MAALWGQIRAWAGWRWLGAVVAALVAGIGLERLRTWGARLRAEGREGERRRQAQVAAKTELELERQDQVAEAQIAKIREAGAREAGRIESESDAEAAAQWEARKAAARKARDE